MNSLIFFALLLVLMLSTALFGFAVYHKLEPATPAPASGGVQCGKPSVDQRISVASAGFAGAAIILSFIVIFWVA